VRIAIGAEFLVAHPGNYKGQTVEQGILNVLESVAEAARGLDFGKLMLLIENTAGAGAQLGSRFERQVCGTPEELDFAEQQGKDTVRQIQQNNASLPSQGH